MGSQFSETWVLAVGAQGDSSVHLVPDAHAQRTLCGRLVVESTPGTRLWSHGCSECLAAARENGQICAQENRAIVNLQRLPSRWS